MPVRRAARGLNNSPAKPVFPGETLAVEIWADGATLSFRANVKERPGTVVLNNGLCLLGD